MYETILFERDGGVATVALNRPKVLNAFNGRMHEEIHDALDSAAADAEETAALAGTLAAMPTRALGQINQTLHASFESDLGNALERKAQGQALCGYTQDHREGAAAFFEKRQPRFAGR